jgi:hypothetical protein
VPQCLGSRWSQLRQCAVRCIYGVAGNGSRSPNAYRRVRRLFGGAFFEMAVHFGAFVGGLRSPVRGFSVISFAYPATSFFALSDIDTQVGHLDIPYVMCQD